MMKPLQVHKTLALCAVLICLLPATTSLAAAAASHGSNSEPTVIFTHKQTNSKDANPPPAWLTVPALLDIQPMLLQVDVRRDVATQLRRFCYSHSIDVTKCGVLLDALNEFVDFDRLCSPQKAKQGEPSFMIIKNLIVSVPSHNNEHQPKSTFTWMQDDAQSIAADLCRFAQTGGDVKSRVRANLPCVLALEAALLRSLAWVNSLESCDLITKQRASAAQTPSRDGYGSPGLTTRVAAVEQSIAAMKSEQQHSHSEEQSAAELPEAAPWMARDEASNTEDTLEEARAVDQERPSTADPTFHQSSSLTDQAIESDINSNDESEKEAATSQEVDFESKVIEDIAASPPDVPVEISSFTRKEDDNVVSSTSKEGQPVMEEGDVHAEDLSVNSLPDESVAEAINPNKEPSSSIGHDGDDDQHAAQDQTRDVTEADRARALETLKRKDRETSAIAKRESDDERPPLDENDLSSGPSITALEDLPASRSSVEEFSTPIKKTEASVDRMQSSIAVEAIGMLPHPDEEAPTPSPEVLEVLSTLAMLFFVFYLVFDLLSIAIRNSVKTLRRHSDQVAQALFPLFSRSESKSTSVRENAVAPLPERDGSDKKSLSLASHSTPRAWVNLIFASSAPRERVSFQHRAEAIEKVTRSYVLRLQKAAFGVWRFGTMSIGPNVALVQCESSEDLSTESTNAIESVQRQPINPTNTLPARTNFTCVAMALMFARHGAIFHPIDQVRDDDSITTSRMTTTPELSLALSQLLEGRRDCAVRRIQQAWRSRHKKQGVKLSITTDSNSNSFQPHTITATSAPSTPLFTLLTKDLRKRPMPKASVTPRLNFAVRRVMTPASSTHLPPAS